MTNRKYEKIKEYTKVAREEFTELTGYSSTNVDKLFLLMIKSLQGIGLTESQKTYFWGLIDLDSYVILARMCNEIVEFMNGGDLPDES